MRLIPFLVLTALGSTCALAEAPDARRRIYPTQDGFLEVDPRTGGIMECKRSADGYQCSQVTERDPLLREEPGRQLQAPATPPQRPNTTDRPTAPTDQEIDRALDVMERFLRRFMGIVREHKPERT